MVNVQGRASSRRYWSLLQNELRNRDALNMKRRVNVVGEAGAANTSRADRVMCSCAGIPSLSQCHCYPLSVDMNA